MKKNRLTKKKLREIQQALLNSIKYIEDNIEHLDEYRREELQDIINPPGYSLIRITNLNEYFKVEEFCTKNSIAFESAF